MKLNKIHFNSSKQLLPCCVLVHDIDECNGSHYQLYISALQEFSFAFVFTYAEELVAQFNGCATSTSQAYARRPLCADDGLTSMPVPGYMLGAKLT